MEWKSEAGHCYVGQAISPFLWNFFACVLAGRDLVSGVQLARRLVLNESEDHWSAIRERHKLDPAYILTLMSPQAFGLAFVTGLLAGLPPCQLTCLL